MNVIKLDKSHREKTQNIFDSVISFDFFSDSYLSGLHSFHAFGIEEQDKITSVVGFYQSSDDASWYLTSVKCMKEYEYKIPIVMDTVIDYNEKNGRLKFFYKVPANLTGTFNSSILSDYNKKRYGFFDEYLVKAKNQPKFTLTWQVLFNRTLLDSDCVIRCSFLKEEYRTIVVDGSNI